LSFQTINFLMVRPQIFWTLYRLPALLDKLLYVLVVFQVPKEIC